MCVRVKVASTIYIIMLIIRVAYSPAALLYT